MYVPQEHYAHYRESVRGDVLPGFKKFCMDMPTKNARQWPTVESYLKHVINCINNCKNTDKYEEWLIVHKETMLAVLTKIVSELCRELDEPSEKVVLDLAHNNSMKYLKFSNLTLEFEGFTVIPRYSTKFFDPESPDGLYLDADELGLLLSLGENVAQAAVEKKKKAKEERVGNNVIRHMKIFNHKKGEGFTWRYLDIANTFDGVRDWVLPLTYREGFLEN